MLVPRWLSIRQLALKYQMDRRTCLKWVRGQAKHSYHLQIIETPAGPRILDPQLELPPHRTAPPDEMFIYRASEIAALAGVTRQWVNRLANQDRLRFRYYGRVRFFPISEARRLLKARRKEYNHVRLHEALEMKTPASVWRWSAKRYQANPPAWEYEPGAEVRQVSEGGYLRLGGYRWEISRALAGEWVQLIRLEGRILVYYCRSLVRELDPLNQRSTAVDRWWGLRPEL